MSSYTTQLKTIIEHYSQDTEDLTTNERIEIGRTNLFDFDYPIFNEAFKNVFETNIIKNFYMREIGFETEGLFKFRLETWLNINMPYFNDLFESELLEYDPLSNTKLTKAYEKMNDTLKKDKRNTNQFSQTDGRNKGLNRQDSDSSGKSTDDDFSRKVGSDNPDSRLQLQTQDGKGVIEYASNIDEQKDDRKVSSEASANTVGNTEDSSRVNSKADQRDSLDSNKNESEHFMEHREGKVGIDSYAKLIQEYRGALLRIELMIHKEMQELFMLVY